MAGKAGGLFVNLGINTAQFQKGIRGARKELTGFQKVGAGLKSTFSPANLGFGAMAAGTALIGAAIGDAVRTFKDFEKAGSDLEAVLGKNALPADLQNLAKQAKDLGASTAFTATEVRQLQKEFAKLGFDPSQIENMTEATLNLAAAAGSELSEAAALAGATINAFGLNSQDASHVTDVMASSFSKSALDMEKFSETMKNAAPIARATGVSLEVATAAAGKLADANISGSKAGTDLKKIFSELVKDGKPFADSLNDVAAKMNAAGTKAEKLAIAENLVGDRAKGALLILADQKDELGLLATELENADGAAKLMADTMLNNLAGDVTKAGSAWEGFILGLEDGSGAISKAMRFIVQSATDLLSTITQFNKEPFFSLNWWKMIGNAAISSLGFIIKPLIAIAKVIDKISGTNLADTLDFKFDIKEVAKETKVLADEVMPNLAKATDTATNSTKKLVKAKRDLVKIDKVGIKGFKSLIEDLTPKQPIPVMIPIKPELKVDANTDEEVVTGAMVDRGVAMGDALASSLVGAANAGLVGIGEAIGDGGSIGDALLNSFSGLLSSFGSQMIALGLAQEALKESLALGPMGAALAIGGGIALIVAAGAIKKSMSESSTGFAQGGLVTGSVFANVGEGRGTTRSNPEVIAPLDKLQNMIAGSGGGMGGEVVFRIQGQELVGILNRQMKVNKFS